jgi:hypothetical protein
LSALRSILGEWDALNTRQAPRVEKRNDGRLNAKRGKRRVHQSKTTSKFKRSDMRNGIQTIGKEEREAIRSRRTASLFSEEMQKAAEPTWVFSRLKQACQRRAALKSDLSPEELDWMRGVLQEGEAALAAVKSLLQGADHKARLVATLKLKNNHYRRQAGLE